LAIPVLSTMISALRLRLALGSGTVIVVLANSPGWIFDLA
jgi:hypothetical protein